MCLRSLVAFQQTGNRLGNLSAGTSPVGNAILSDTEAFGTFFGYRVVEADTLDETTITTATGICNDYVEERTVFGATAGKTNNDHDYAYLNKIGKKTAILR